MRTSFLKIRKNRDILVDHTLYYTKENAHIHIKGSFPELQANIDPNIYHKHIITRINGQNILYAETFNTIHGTFNTSLML